MSVLGDEYGPNSDTVTGDPSRFGPTVSSGAGVLVNGNGANSKDVSRVLSWLDETVAKGVSGVSNKAFLMAVSWRTLPALCKYISKTM